jgi:tetratricopeptide (TPR) repeat protein
MTKRDFKNAGLLHLETVSGRVLFEGQALPKVTPHWAYIYGLLALRHLEGTHEITSEEIALLPTWINVSALSIGPSLFRHNISMHKQGLDLIVSPERETTKRFFLNKNRVARVITDVSDKELRSWLGISEKRESSKIANFQVLLKLELARTIFEIGRFAEVESICREALDLPGRFDEKLLALAQIAWVKTFIASKSESRQAIEELQEALKVFKNTRSDDSVSPNIEARVWIQTARHYWRHLEPSTAMKALDRAEKLLQPANSMEWAAIHAGRGFLAQKAGKLDQAAVHNLAAFNYAAQAQWRWSMTAQVVNRCAILMELYHQNKVNDLDHAKSYLIEAIQWITLSLALANEMDAGGAADLEINLMLIYTWLEQFDDARLWLKKAENIVNASKLKQDSAELNYEAAELEVATGNGAAAIVRLERSVCLYDELEMRVQLKAAKKRLKEYRARYLA